MNLRELAIQIATVAHGRDLDKAGKPYIDHPLRVGLAVAGIGLHAEIAGYLHDTVEDTKLKLSTIQHLFGNEVVGIVLSVTRVDPAYEDRLGFHVLGKETYKDFVMRSARHPIGKLVKLADIEDNMSPERFNALPENEKGTMTRYIKAKRYLIEGVWE